jgi:hypothetical protein
MSSANGTTNVPLHILIPDFMDKDHGHCRSAEEKVSLLPSEITYNCSIPTTGAKRRCSKKWNKRVQSITGHLDSTHFAGKKLGYDTTVHGVMIESYQKIIDSIPLDAIILNLCDGMERDGFPGLFILRLVLSMRTETESNSLPL